jgi:hypothetical protein
MGASSATIREALCQQGLNGAELDAGVLAYKIANNLPDATEAEEIAELKRFVGAYVYEASTREITP